MVDEKHNGREAAPKRASAELKAILEALIFASPEPLIVWQNRFSPPASL